LEALWFKVRVSYVVIRETQATGYRVNQERTVIKEEIKKPRLHSILKVREPSTERLEILKVRAGVT